MNRYIIAVIWKTYDQLWNPKLENLQNLKFGKLVINCGIQN
jgi:hypothetical protein